MPSQPPGPRAPCAMGSSLLPASLGAPGSRRSVGGACSGGPRVLPPWRPLPQRAHGLRAGGGSTQTFLGPRETVLSWPGLEFPARGVRPPRSVHGAGWSGQGDLPWAPGSLTDTLGHGVGARAGAHGTSCDSGAPWVPPPGSEPAPGTRSRQPTARTRGADGGEQLSPGRVGTHCPTRCQLQAPAGGSGEQSLDASMRRPGWGQGSPPCFTTNPGRTAPPPRRTVLRLVLWGGRTHGACGARVASGSGISPPGFVEDAAPPGGLVLSDAGGPGGSLLWDGAGWPGVAFRGGGTASRPARPLVGPGPPAAQAPMPAPLSPSPSAVPCEARGARPRWRRPADRNFPRRPIVASGWTDPGPEVLKP